MVDGAKILLFEVAADKCRQIEAVCRNLRIQAIRVKPASYHQTLGYLAGIKGFNRTQTADTDEKISMEMLVFSGMDSQFLDTFLAAYKTASIPPIGLKAVLTPYNINWTATTLYTELCKEHFSHALQVTNPLKRRP